MQIEIAESLFARLQKHATPFVHTTPAHVIEHLVDFFESKKSESNTITPRDHNTADAPAGIRNLDPKRPPSFLHAMVRGEFGSLPFSNWNEMVRVAHIEAHKKAGNFEALRTATTAQVVSGVRSDAGYRYVPEIKMSIQGVDADRAWQHSLRLAIYAQKPIKAWVTWRLDDNAAYPGESVFISWSPQ